MARPNPAPADPAPPSPAAASPEYLRHGKTRQVGASASSSVVVPNLGQGEVNAAPPDIGPSAPFLWMVHPRRWIVLEGEVVPNLGKLKLQGGVNGVRVVQDKRTKAIRILAQRAIANAREAGWIIIPLDVDGPGTSYLRAPDLAPWATLSRFEEVFGGSPDIRADTPAYVAWLRSLMPGGDHPRAGLIPEPPEHVLEAMLEAAWKRLASVDDKVAAQPSLKPKADRYRRVYEAIRLKLEELRQAARGDDRVPASSSAAALELDTSTDPADVDEADDDTPEPPKRRRRK